VSALWGLFTETQACPGSLVPVPQTEVTHHADPLLTGVGAVGVEPAQAAWSLYSVVLTLAIEMEATGQTITF